MERPTVEQWQRNGHYIETVSPPLGGHCQLTICDIYGEGDTIKDTGDFIVKAHNCHADLVAALKAALPYLEHSVKFYRYQQAGHEFWPNREEAEGNITEARAAIEKAEGN